MRRLAVLFPMLLLSGCGFGHFLGDSFTLPGADPNAPIGDSENMLRVRSQQVAIVPLLPEPGNVWPGPPPPEPTLSDIQRQQNQQPVTPPAVPALPDHRQPQPGGRLATPGQQQAPFLPGLSTTPAPTPAPGPGLAGTPAPPPVNNFRQSPSTGNIVIPNGNGTSTVIGPNGAVSTIPTPH